MGGQGFFLFYLVTKGWVVVIHEPTKVLKTNFSMVYDLVGFIEDVK